LNQAWNQFFHKPPPTITGESEVAKEKGFTNTVAGSGLTFGVIADTRHIETANIEGRSQIAREQLLIASENGTPFSAPGDSGSVILNYQHKVVGLLWGTNSCGRE